MWFIKLWFRTSVCAYQVDGSGFDFINQKQNLLLAFFRGAALVFYIISKRHWSGIQAQDASVIDRLVFFHWTKDSVWFMKKSSGIFLYVLARICANFLRVKIQVCDKILKTLRQDICIAPVIARWRGIQAPNFYTRFGSPTCFGSKVFDSLKQTRKLQLEWLKLCGLIVSLRRGPGEICSDACAESLLRCCGYHDQLPLDKQVKLIKIDKVCPSEPAYLESSCVWLFPGCGSGSAWVRIHSSSWIRIQVKILKNEKWKENIGTNNYIVLYA